MLRALRNGLWLPLAVCYATAAHGGSLRFFGHGSGSPGLDRVKIRVDDPSQPADVGPPLDVGATDFTIEFWVRGTLAENQAPAAACDTDASWIAGNIVVDCDRFNQSRSYGVSFLAGTVAFGVSGTAGSATVCAAANVLDDRWHHVAVQRRRADGWLRIHVDGALAASVDGPDGDISYADDGVPGNFCNGPCTDSDPCIVIGAEKHDAGPAYPAFSGWVDELRFSATLRYDSQPFAPPVAPFAPDALTVGLYHFDEGVAEQPCEGIVTDSSAATGGPSPGTCHFGGAPPAGPVYSAESPFAAVAQDVPLPAGALLTLALALAMAGIGSRRRA